jgi:hypothetical protein
MILGRSWTAVISRSYAGLGKIRYEVTNINVTTILVSAGCNGRNNFTENSITTMEDFMFF